MKRSYTRKGIWALGTALLCLMSTGMVQAQIASAGGGPVNDLCSGAIPVSCGDAVVGSTVGATATDAPGSFLVSEGVWYSFTGNDQLVTVSTCDNADFDTEIVVAEGSCGNLTVVGNNDDNPSCTGNTSELTFEAYTGTTYYIYVGDWNSSTTNANSGTFTLSVTCASIPPPANDLCSGAESISCGNAVTGNTTFATEQTVTTYNGGTVGQGVWYTFTGTGLDVTLSTCDNADFDTEINVFTGDCNTLTNVAGNDDGTLCGSGTSEVTFTTTAGETYYVYVSDWISGGVGGTFTLTLSCAAPANDLCSGAIPVNCGDAVVGSTVGATATDAPGSFLVSEGVWYSFTGNDQLVTVSTCDNADFDTEIVVAEGSCGGLIVVGNNDDNASCTGNTSELAFEAYTGTTYYIYVGDYSSSTTNANSGTFTLSVTCASIPPPANDLCSGAESISCGDAVTGNTTFATEQTVTTYNGGTVGQGVWYTFTGTGLDVTLSTCDAADFDTEINVFTGDCNTLTNVAGNDDGTLCGSGTSEVTFTTTAGETYYVYVSDWISGGTGGTFTLTLSCAAPANDLCTGAIPVSCGDQISGTTGPATADGSLPFCGTSLTTAPGVWYSLAGNGMNVTASLCGSSYDTKIGVFSGDCNALTCVGGNDDACSLQSEYTFYAAPGVDYYIYVTGFSTNAGAFDLSITCACPTTDAGTATADAASVCMSGGSATIGVTADGNQVVPAGYTVLTVLADASGTILDGGTFSYTVTAPGDYYIHIGVVNPADLVSYQAAATVADLYALTVAGGGTLCGSIDQTGVLITVGQEPTADFTYVDNGNLMVSFTDASPGTPTSWVWDFGDGNVSTVQNPSHTYALDGVYTVCLIAMNGCDMDGDTLCIPVTVSPAGPANDECSGAVSLTQGAVCSTTTGDVTGATESMTGCAGTADDDVWFSFVATDVNATVDVQGSASFDAVFEVFDGSCGSLNSLGCVDNTFSGGLETTDLTGLTVGNTYYIRVYHYFGSVPATTTFDICVYMTPPPPANDECAGAQLLQVGTSCVTTAGDVTSATQSMVGCAGTADDDVWFSFVANAATATVDVSGSASFDAVLEVFDGSCGSLNSLDCVDNTLSGDVETVDLTGLTVGNTYYIRVYHWFSSFPATPTFDICVYNVVTGINEALEDGIAVYPNPSNGRFVVEVNGVEADAQLEVIEMSGRTVFSQSVTMNGSFRKELDLNVANGSYLLRIATTEGVVVRKLQIH